MSPPHAGVRADNGNFIRAPGLVDAGYVVRERHLRRCSGLLIRWINLRARPSIDRMPECLAW